MGGDGMILSEQAEVKREKKLEDFRRLKEELAKINNHHEETQEDFNQYINSLNKEDICKYATGIREIMSLCNNNLFKCEFRSKEKFNINNTLKFECEREKILRLKSILQ